MMNSMAFRKALVKSVILFSVMAVSCLSFELARAAVPEGAGTSAEAAKESAGSAKVKTKKSTEVNFDDVLVQGKYHFSDEAVTTVEQDKILDALLGVRTDFKDRLSKSAARH